MITFAWSYAKMNMYSFFSSPLPLEKRTKSAICQKKVTTYSSTHETLGVFKKAHFFQNTFQNEFISDCM